MSKYSEENFLNAYRAFQEESDASQITMEAFVCNERHQLGILLEIRPHDHGDMDKNKVILNHPAHLHVYKQSKSPSNELRSINLTGPCPETVDDILEMDTSSNKPAIMRKYREKILDWAKRPISSKNKKDGAVVKTEWETAQDKWAGTANAIPSSR